MPAIPSEKPKGKRDDYYRDRRRRKVCTFCADKTVMIDYKEVNRLRRYLSERAKIEPRRKTGTCADHQRQLAVALKRARTWPCCRTRRSTCGPDSMEPGAPAPTRLRRDGLIHGRG